MIFYKKLFLLWPKKKSTTRCLFNLICSYFIFDSNSASNIPNCSDWCLLNDANKKIQKFDVKMVFKLFKVCLLKPCPPFIKQIEGSFDIPERCFSKLLYCFINIFLKKLSILIIFSFVFLGGQRRNVWRKTPDI